MMRILCTPPDFGEKIKNAIPGTRKPNAILPEIPVILRFVVGTRDPPPVELMNAYTRNT